MSHKIPLTKVDLITGFLGAGKTTFLKNYAAYCASRNEHFIIIENEFGKAGVDAQLLSDADYDVTQLVGGCICCGQKVNFHDRILELSADYDRIIVEPSGIYTLEDFYEIMESPPVQAVCTIGTILAIVDPTQLYHLSESARKICYSQTAGASVILINQKMSVISSPEAECMNMLQKIWTDYGKQDRLVADVALTANCEEISPALCAKLQAVPPYRNHLALAKEDHSYIYQNITIQPVFSSADELDRAMRHWLSGSCGAIIRVKGFLTLPGGELYEINCTPETYHIHPITKAHTDFLHADLGLNIIGDHIDRAAIRSTVLPIDSPSSLQVSTATPPSPSSL